MLPFLILICQFSVTQDASLRNRDNAVSGTGVPQSTSAKGVLT